MIRTAAGPPFAIGNPAELTDLDIACAMPLGCRGDRARVATAVTPAAIRERVLGPALARGRCCVPFSGGVESAMWLAAVTDHARRHGYPDPVALTLRHPGLATAEHLRAQERIVAHLGLADWERVDADDGLDLVGPLAASVLSRTGPLWPANAFMMTPLVRAARGGVFLLVTGVSDFFAWWRWSRLASVLRGERRPERCDLAMLAGALLPAPLRTRVLASRRTVPPMAWLRPDARREVVARLQRRASEVPVRCDRALVTQATHRCFAASAATIGAIGRLVGTDVEQPLSRPGTMEMIAGAAGRRGDDGVWPALRRLCGDLLPAALLSTGRGPALEPVFFAQASREFAAGFDGVGLDESIVDTDALRRSWLSDRPDPRTACLLQFAWLASGGGEGPIVSTTR